jgi:endonuclease/exonuclease/phosphatase family metal-dependent hydrolase
VVDVRVGTWNLENLFRPGGQFGPRQVSVYQDKLDGLAATITGMAPDLLGVQEVGAPEALDDLLGRLGSGWSVALSRHFAADHPIRVGVLSRLPITVLADVAAFPAPLAPIQATDPDAGGVIGSATQAGRGVLAVAARLPDGRTLRLVVCHLKSKLLSYPPGPTGQPRFEPRDEGERARVGAYALYRRAAEAATARAVADTMLAAAGADGRTTPVILVGDLNDEPGAATTQILYGPAGSQLGTPGFAVPDKGDAHRLWNLAQRIPEADRYTRRYEGHGELIDHILTSRALLDPLPKVEVIRQAGQGTLPDVGPNPTGRRDQPASDHAAVLAHLTL